VSARSQDDRALRGARWWLTTQIAGVITLVVVAVGVVSLCLVTHGQEADGRRELAGSLVYASVDHPWPCVWLFEQRDGELRRTPAAPGALPVRADLAAVSRTHPVLVARHRAGGIDYLVRTEWHPGGVRQATLDLRYQTAERHRLYLALAVAEVLGLVCALATGRWLACRAVRPLLTALARQRRFVADASHELRTPLTQLHTRAQLLARRVSDDPELSRELAALVGGTRQFGEVLTDLLMSAELGDGYSAEPVDLAALVAAVAVAEEARLASGDVKLDVTGAAQPVWVTGTAPALRRVVNAVVDNAIGHTPPGGRIEMSLPDDGVGLEPGAAARIFHRFARGSYGSGRRFGLGLALVREIVTAHRGSIAATANPAGGATFTIRLPR